MASRLVLYGAVSTLGAASVIGSALHTRANFYAAAVAVGRSSGALMVLANFALFNTICFGILVKTIFFGRLRSIEYEHLFEKLWLFVTESLLALTIFRDDFSAPFAVMYGLLLFLKCFHWITADRVDYMDQIPPPGPPTLFHVRCSLIISFLTLIDVALVIYSLESIVVDGVSSMVLFASEFMILLASIGGTSARYGVGLIDLRRARGRADAPSWEEKSMYLFYVDLGVDFVKLLTYLTFFLVILLNYGLPPHILRDVYMTLRSFLSRCSDLIRYRRATKDMDSLYPNATVEDMTRNDDRTCIICREEMVPHQTPAERAAATAAALAEGREAPPEVEEGGPNETPKRLQCGHIFHFHCLRSWLERQQSCPTCRRDVLRNPAASRPGRPGANGVNVQINPPAPAPGAVPRINAVAGAPNPIQAVYDQYFRPPQPPAVPPAPTAAPLPTAEAGTSVPESRDQHIQRGIWGGPIAPGRFFATPLGAAPTWPPSTSQHTSTSLRMPVPIPATRSQGVHMPIIRLPEPSSGGTSGGSSHTATPPSSSPAPISIPPSIPITEQEPRRQRQRSSIDSLSGDEHHQILSGANTPHTSNPPEIFTRAGSNSTPPEEAASEDGGSGRARRAAADAALRRMGLRSGSIASAALRLSPVLPTSAEILDGGERTARPNGVDEVVSAHQPVEEKLETETNEAMRTEGRNKGKRKAVDPLEEEPRVVPYLTESGSDLLSSTPRLRGQRQSLSARLSRVGDEEGTGLMLEGTERALEERLRLLREVDEVVWGLVGELSRVQSGWEGGREAARRTDGE